MKWIAIILLAWLLISFPLAVGTGKIIHRNNSEEHMKGSDTRADAGKNQVAD